MALHTHSGQLNADSYWSWLCLTLVSTSAASASDEAQATSQVMHVKYRVDSNLALALYSAFDRRKTGGWQHNSTME